MIKIKGVLLCKEDPVVAYENYLTYSGEDVREDVIYNKDMLNALSGIKDMTEKKSAIDASRISTQDGRFEALKPLVGHNLYCAKLTIRNINKAFLSFHFGERIFDRTVGIEAEPDDSKQLRIAYRNIVPSEFKQPSSRSMAGPMGYNEYIIDGTHCNNENRIFLNFYINSNFKWTPIKIVLENCKGSCHIRGLSDEEIAKRFENKCNEKDLLISQMPKLGHSLK